MWQQAPSRPAALTKLWEAQVGATHGGHNTGNTHDAHQHTGHDTAQKSTDRQGQKQGGGAQAISDTAAGHHALTAMWCVCQGEQVSRQLCVALGCCSTALRLITWAGDESFPASPGSPQHSPKSHKVLPPRQADLSECCCKRGISVQAGIRDDHHQAQRHQAVCGGSSKQQQGGGGSRTCAGSRAPLVTVAPQPSCLCGCSQSRRAGVA